MNNKNQDMTGNEGFSCLVIRRQRHMRFRSRCAQKGVVLFIALIALVAMTLTAIALMRSVDTTTLIAGNIALRQGALQEADKIMNSEAFTACMGKGGKLAFPSVTAPPGVLDTTSSSQCPYHAQLEASNAKPPYGVPDWLKTTSTGTYNAATGNTSEYMIERMCDQEGPWSPDPPMNCVESPFGRPSKYIDGHQRKPLKPAQALYRVSVKVTGPGGSIVYTQMILNAGI